MSTQTMKQKGSVLVLVSVSMVLIMIAMAMVFDIGWMLINEAQLQNAADSASLAAASQLVDEDILTTGTNDLSEEIIVARDYAETFAGLNKAGSVSLAIDRNDYNETTGGVVVGYIDNPVDQSSPLQTIGTNDFNSVKVRVERSQNYNGLVGLMFGSVTGLDQIDVIAESTSTLDNRIIGFEVGNDGVNLPMLPFTIYKPSWDAATNGNQPLENEICPDEPDMDNYAFNNGLITKGVGDGIPEVKLYPYKDGICGQSDLPGNFGTIDIGYASNSASDLSRQILEGITKDELDTIGGLTLYDDDGDGVPTKWFNGDTGVSNTLKGDLEFIAGETRIIPLYIDAYGTGDGVNYNASVFVGVRIMDVVMTGALADRHVLVQPCMVISPHAIIDPEAPKSKYVYALSITR